MIAPEVRKLIAICIQVSSRPKREWVMRDFIGKEGVRHGAGRS